ncbi:uncharacterized protein C8A04DRAFT_26106 [Dichotomopilus funicola]|uniref:Uncharacterized protein n=1 Tax=Dichotomopilus funicola TaxID=1934379 RepID=A0AAN6V7S0_9PEZI|nr:hypothetical protein C8A04DRAFT_26106 [Dichotomopilus funicola]
MNRQPPTRPISTSARVHPPYLPYLHNASRTKSRSLKWLPPLAAVVTAGYAVSSYRDGTQLTFTPGSFSSSSPTSPSHLPSLSSSTSSPASSSPSSSSARYSSAVSPPTSGPAQQAEMERLRREAAMAEAYGDRGSLAELERAMAVYEAQRR